MNPATKPKSPPRPVHALLKGMACLATIAQHDGLTLVEAVRALKLPKSTVYRLLETLRLGGYLVQDDALRYRASALAGNLAPRHQDNQWVREAAYPALVALGNAAVWPVGIATPAGISMYVQSTTSDKSPLAIERFRAGMTLRMDTTAAGYLFLAYQSQRLRGIYLAALRRQSAGFETPTFDRPAFEQRLTKIRADGYVIMPSTHMESVLCVPVLLERRIVAVVGMRYIRKALSNAEVMETFVPLLTATTRKIAAEISSRKMTVKANEIQPPR